MSAANSTPPWYQNVVTYVPYETCSRISPWEADPNAAATFDVAERTYWVDEIVPTMIPGLVLGGLALIGFVTSLIWLCVRPHRARIVSWRQRRASRKGKRQDGLAAEGTAQFISAAELASGSGSKQLLVAAQLPASSTAEPWHQGGQRLCSKGLSTWPPPRAWWRRHSGQREGPLAAWSKLLLVLLGAGLAGVAVWGIVQSILATNDVIGEFWALTDEVDALVDGVYNASAALSGSIAAMQPPLEALSDAAGRLAPAVSRALGAQGAELAAALEALDGADLSQLTAASDALNSTVLPAIRDSIQPAFEDLYDWQPPTMSIQDTWRFVIIAVLLGLVIVFAAATSWAVAAMRRGMLASVLTALTWLGVALLMLGGVGVLQGVQHVSRDGCLYTETSLLRRAAGISNPTSRALVTNAMNYYFGVTNLTTLAAGAAGAALQAAGALQPEAASAVLDRVLGTNVTLEQAIEAVQAVNSSVHSFLTDGSQLEAAQGVIEAAAPGAVAQLRALEAALAQFLVSVGALQGLLLRPNVEPLYHHGKAYICCTIHGAASDVWVPWTVTGSLGLVFALLASARVVWHTLAVPPPPGPQRCAACCARCCCCWCCVRGSRERQLEARAAAGGDGAEEGVELASSGPSSLVKASAPSWKAGSESGGVAPGPDGPASARSDWMLSAAPPGAAAMYRNPMDEP